MKVHIGPYRNYFSTYHLVEPLKYLGISEDVRDKIADCIPSAPFEWFCNLRKRKIKVRIDRYDTWNMDNTLAHIIHPMLLQLKETKHGSPWVDDEDVPEELRSTSASPKENEWDIDDNHEKRWNYVLDEMIYSFACEIDDEWEDQFHSGDHDIEWVQSDFESDGEKTFEMVKGPNDTYVFDREAYDKAFARRKNGLRLFAKYYHNLWD